MPFAAARVVADFDRRTATGTFGEVRLFRALLDSITSAAPDVQVAEYHGGGHQVSHATVRHVGLGVRRCELSDLMVVAFHRNRPVSPRLTFLQAKYERGLHRTSRPPSGNYVQWSLLAGRQPISGCGKFRPPTGLLSGALLPSVGTFGFFVDGASRGARYDLVYSSADVLAPTHSAPAIRKYGRLDGPVCLAPPARLLSWGFQFTIGRRAMNGIVETVAASSLDLFLTELFSLRIGTPVMQPGWPVASWLATELRFLGGPLAAELGRQLDQWLAGQAGLPGRGDDDLPPEGEGDRAGRFPSRSVLLLSTSLDLEDERRHDEG